MPVRSSKRRTHATVSGPVGVGAAKTRAIAAGSGLDEAEEQVGAGHGRSFP